MPPAFILKDNIFEEKFNIIEKFPNNYYIREVFLLFEFYIKQIYFSY